MQTSFSTRYRQTLNELCEPSLVEDVKEETRHEKSYDHAFSPGLEWLCSGRLMFRDNTFLLCPFITERIGFWSLLDLLIESVPIGW